MTLQHHAFDATDDDLLVDEWTIDEFDAIEDPSELDSIRSSIAALGAFDD